MSEVIARLSSILHGRKGLNPFAAPIFFFVTFVCCVLMAPTTTVAAPAPISLTRGVLLVSKFRTQSQLNAMSGEDQRNTLITELAGRTRDNVGFYQGLNDADLAGAGTLLAYLRHTGSRTDAQIATMSADDMRNTVIVEVGIQTGRGADLQGLPNIDLINLVMGPERSYIRGVLLVGRFRTQSELNAMSGEDQRNTLITELAGRTRDSVGFYQGLNDADLAGAGALLVYLRHTGSRTDAEITTMSADDMRNTVIVEIHAQTRRSDLQALRNMQLALLALGTRQLRGLDTIPEHLWPGPHTMTLRVNRYLAQTTHKGYSDVPFFGIFVGRNVDCTRGFTPPPAAGGMGETFSGLAGWGQVEGDGHPGASSDQCTAWITSIALNFDMEPISSIPPPSFERAVLKYQEADSGKCAGLAYTQGGFLLDLLPCWTNGEGELENKPNGCLALRVPKEDWMQNPPAGRPVGLMDFPVQKIAPSAWDITGLFRARHYPGLGPPFTGFGYMLIGEPVDIGNLTADDNTRCTSRISDIRLDVSYTIPPLQEEYDFVPPN